jgi:hypothetical protein
VCRSSGRDLVAASAAAAASANREEDDCRDCDGDERLQRINGRKQRRAQSGPAGGITTATFASTPDIVIDGSLTMVLEKQLPEGSWAMVATANLRPGYGNFGGDRVLSSVGRCSDLHPRRGCRLPHADRDALDHGGELVLGDDERR